MKAKLDLPPLSKRKLANKAIQLERMLTRLVIWIQREGLATDATIKGILTGEEIGNTESNARTGDSEVRPSEG